MSKLGRFFAFIRAIPFWRFFLFLVVLGGVGIGGHAVFGAAKGCASIPERCKEWEEVVDHNTSGRTCPFGGYMSITELKSTAYNGEVLVHCSCDKPKGQ